MAFFLTIGHSRSVSVPGSLHLPWQLIIRRFELSDKTYSKNNFGPATRGASAGLLKLYSVRRARKLEEFEHRVVRPRIKSVVGAHEYKEARDYLAFWKAVDDVVRVVKSVSMREWPGVPLYLAVDHFWHWLVKVWNKDGRERISADPKLRTKRLPKLFTAYAHWDKSSSKYTSRMKKNSDYLRRILAMNHLPKLTKVQARDAYNRLNSGHMRTKRFGADRTFANANALSRMKRAF